MGGRAAAGARRRQDGRDFIAAAAAMTLVVLASNLAVQYPVRAFGLADYLTFGAFTYPAAFLVTDLANRRFGPRGARRVVYLGFAAAVALSAWLATPRIAIASGAAFLSAQLLDIAIFQRLRHAAWWLPPFASSVVASALDTLVFFGLAFSCGPLPGLGLTVEDLLAPWGLAGGCEGLPWVSLALADYAVKLVLAALFIAPYGLMLPRLRTAARGAG